MLKLIPNSDKTALIIGKENFTFKDLTAIINDKKARLRSLPQSGILVLKASKSMDFIGLVLACLQERIPLAVFSEDWTEKECELRIEKLGNCCEIDNQGNLSVLTLNPEVAVHTETALVLFTSGSSGSPRAVQLSLENIESNTRAVIDSLKFSHVKEQTLFLPFSYSFGLLGQLLPGLLLEIPTKILNNLIELKALIDTDELKGMLSGVPSHHETILRLMGDKQLNGVSHVVSAGARLEVELRKKLIHHFPEAVVFNNYGQTEASPRILSMNSEHPDFLSEAVGFPVGDFEIKINSDGEFCAQGRQVMLGYLGEEKATAKKLKSGWLFSGDLAEVDSKGLVSILGRNDELFKIGGERLSPFEIENELKQIHGVKDAAIAFHEHPIYGVRILAFLESQQALLPGRKITPFLKKRLSKNKIPSAYYQLAALPKNENGKLQRKKLLEKMEQAKVL